MSSPPPAGPGESPDPGSGHVPGDAAVNAAARLVRHRNYLSTAQTSFLILILLDTIGLRTLDPDSPDSQSVSQWAWAFLIACGILWLAMTLLIRRENAALRRYPADVRSRARELAGPEWSWRRVGWSVLYVSCALFLGFTLVVMVPMTLDSAAYLDRVGPTAMFTPRSYNYSCDDNGDCTQVTDGVLGTGASVTSYTWPSTVPLGRPFRIYRDLLPWPPFNFDFSNDGNAIVSLCIGLVFDAISAVVVWEAVLWRRGELTVRFTHIRHLGLWW